MAAIKLIVGLGNPGSEHEQTRHNAGFWFVDEVARRCGGTLRKEARFHGDVARCTIEGHDVRLLKPTTFMNRSGQSAAALANFYRISMEEILVVHDELDLPVGTAKLKCGGGHGGHNGLRDLVDCLGGKAFYRLRLGIGHPGHKDKVVGYVLKRPAKEDRIAIDAVLDECVDVLPQIVAGEFEKAMHRLHSS